MSPRETLVRAVYRVLCSPAVARFVDRLHSVSQRGALADLLANLGIDCVIDVGANEGQYARLLRRLRFRGMILSFEPNADAFRTLSRAFAHDPAWRGSNCGLGSADGELEFNVFERSQAASFLPPSESLHSRLVRTVKVPVRRLDAVLPTVLPDWSSRRLFVKCDTQGFDLEVVRGAEGVMQSIQGLQSEIAVQTLYRGMPRYLDALRFYESSGFSLVELWPNNKTVDGLALEYDCLMRRTARSHDGRSRADSDPTPSRVT